MFTCFAQEMGVVLKGAVRHDMAAAGNSQFDYFEEWYFAWRGRCSGTVTQLEFG